MVATPHQGKGYGRKAIEHLIEYVKTQPAATESDTPGKAGGLMNWAASKTVVRLN